MNRITKEQAKIIILTLVLFILIIGFIFFIYSPQRLKLDSIKNNLTIAEAQIFQFNKLTQGEDLSKVVQDLNQGIKGIAASLPKSDENIIRYLSEATQDLGIEIQNLVPSEGEVLENPVAGYYIKKQKITMNILCDFKKLGKYLYIIRDEIPLMINVDGLMIEGQGEGEQELKIQLKFSAFLVRGA